MALGPIQCQKRGLLRTWRNPVGFIPYHLNRVFEGMDTHGNKMIVIQNKKTLNQLKCGTEAESIPTEKLSMDDLTPMEKAMSCWTLRIRENSSEQRKEPKVKHSCGQLQKKKTEAFARREKVLSRKERHQLWENKNWTHGRQPQMKLDPLGFRVIWYRISTVISHRADKLLLAD